MADTIKIKRSDTTATPSSLAAGELAYSESSGHLFYGRIADGAPIKIGGKADVDKLAAIEPGAEVNTVTSVAGRTGAVVLTHADLSDFDAEVNVLIGATSLNGLSNVNAGSPGDGQVLTWVGASSEWQPQAAPSGVTNFVALNDTPSSFSGAGGYFAKVNSGATAVEFVDGIDGGTF